MASASSALTEVSLYAEEAMYFMQTWAGIVEYIHDHVQGLALEEGQPMPYSSTGFHQMAQAGYIAYKALMRVSGYGCHPIHVENERIFEEYCASLPPISQDGAPPHLAAPP